MTIINLIKAFFVSIKNNKTKVFVLLVSTLVFLFVLFPFDDLGDLVSTQVSTLTNNSLFVQFDRLRMSLFPQMGVQLQKVYIESLNTPALSAEELTITPSLGAVIYKKPYGHLNIHKFLKGDIDLHIGSGKRSDNGTERNKLELEAKKISLHDIRQLVDLPLMLKGQVDLQSTALADFNLTEQPEMDLNMTISQFELPPSNVNTSFGPLTVPDLKLTSVELKGRLAAGKFIIENGTIGKDSDELYGNIKGSLDINILNSPSGPTPQIGGYNFEIDLKTKKSFQTRAALFLTFIDTYKTNTSDGAQYKFKISAMNMQMPPNIGPTR